MAVTGTETAVLVLCTGGAPSTSASAGLTRVRSVTDCVVSLAVVSWLGTAAVAVFAVSGSSGGLESVPSRWCHGHCELSVVLLA